MDPNSASAIAGNLQDDIRLRRLPPGSVLKQDDLAARFGVSRQPVRLALEILRSAGLVAARPDRSVEVVGLSAEAQGDLLDLRLLVERQALALAMAQMDRRNLLGARHLQDRIEIESDPKLLEELDCAFHGALYKACGNARLLKLIDDLRREDRRPYHEQPAGSPARARWTRQHRALLRKCAAGDAGGAVAALDEHFSQLKGN
jgi:DNA-binding GntR family transcriptional regulator